MKVLFIVPHCDDEVLGFGGTINKYISLNYDVSVCFVQDKNCKRSEAQLKNSKDAKQILGYHNDYCLNISRDDLTNSFNSVVNIVEKFVLSEKPDILFTTSPSDNHQHHKILYNVISIVTRPHNKNKIKKIYAGEVLSSCNQTFGINRHSFTPNYYEVLDEVHIDKKIKALEAYKTECQPFPHSRSPQSIKAWAISRGSECHAGFAEAFMLLREVSL